MMKEELIVKLRREVDVSHLFLGDAAANAADMRRKGRGCNPPVRRGEKHSMARLSRDDVRYMRVRRRAGASLATLASEYQVSVSAISRACRGDTWS